MGNGRGLNSLVAAKMMGAKTSALEHFKIASLWALLITLVLLVSLFGEAWKGGRMNSL